MTPFNRPQPTTKIVVHIDEVDIPTRTVHARDKTNATIQASFRESQGAVLRIPSQGEAWICKRNGYEWHLDQKLDSFDEHDLVRNTMTPGDARIASDGTLHLHSDEIQVNGYPLGVTLWEAFTTDGVVAAFTLAFAPIPLSVQMFASGLLVDPRTLTVDDRTISVATAPASGSVVVYYQASVPLEPLVLAPGDGVVTSPVVMTRS